MHQVSQKSIVRELDANELESMASDLVQKKDSQGLTDQEQQALDEIPKCYKQLTGIDIVVETNHQIVS